MYHWGRMCAMVAVQWWWVRVSCRWHTTQKFFFWKKAKNSRCNNRRLVYFQAMFVARQFSHTELLFAVTASCWLVYLQKAYVSLECFFTSYSLLSTILSPFLLTLSSAVFSWNFLFHQRLFCLSLTRQMAHQSKIPFPFYTLPCTQPTCLCSVFDCSRLWLISMQMCEKTYRCSHMHRETWQQHKWGKKQTTIEWQEYRQRSRRDPT